jgi:hypothetical protein
LDLDLAQALDPATAQALVPASVRDSVPDPVEGLARGHQERVGTAEPEVRQRRDDKEGRKARGRLDRKTGKYRPLQAAMVPGKLDGGPLPPQEFAAAEMRGMRPLVLWRWKPG